VPISPADIVHMITKRLSIEILARWSLGGLGASRATSAESKLETHAGRSWSESNYYIRTRQPLLTAACLPGTHLTDYELSERTSPFLLSKRECNKLFLQGFHPDNHATLFPYLIDKRPSQLPEDFDFREIFNIANAVLSRRILKAEAEATC